MVTEEARRSPDEARRWEPQENTNIAENCSQSFSFNGFFILLLALSRVKAAATLNMENLSCHQVSGRIRALKLMISFLISPANRSH